ELVPEVAEHARAHGFGFAVLKDEGSKIADAYGAQHTPEAYLVDQKGTLVYHGRIDDRHDDPTQAKSHDAHDAPEALLAGQPIARAETKAFGCSIKR